MKMALNLIAITLIATSITVAGGFFSPTPKPNEDQKVIVKEGHKDVVVEYAGDAADAGNTKVSVSPSESQPDTGPVEDQLSRVTASVVGVSEDVTGKAKDVLFNYHGPFGAGPRELICDSVGNCKHRIAGMLSKAKEKAMKAEEKIKEVALGVTSTVEERTEGVRQNAQEKTKEVGEKLGERVRGTGEMAWENAEKVKEKTGEVVEETAEKVKQKGVEGKKKFSHIGKRGKEVISDTIGHIFWPKSVGSLMGVIQIMGFAMAYGISMWVTFEMSHILAGMLPRHQFGMVQSKIYPLYFKAMVGSIGLALLGHLTRQRGNLFKNKAEMLQGFNLMVSLLSVLVNLRFLEPRATKVMFERMKMEKEEGRGIDSLSAPTTARVTAVREVTDAPAADPTPTATTTTNATPPEPQPVKDETESKVSKLDHRLRQLNSLSSLLNIATLMGLTWHLMYLGDRLALNS